jgi:hypothetical protein
VAADQLYALGFGNVHINFETPAGYLLGFRDYVNFNGRRRTGARRSDRSPTSATTAVCGRFGDDQDVKSSSSVTDDLDEDGIRCDRDYHDWSGRLSLLTADRL